MHKINVSLASNSRAIAFFRPDPNNARLHPDASIASIANSLDAFGQNKPVVCLEDGTVIAGNGMLAAALRLGWTHLAAVTFADAARAKAYAVADNRTAEHSQWDPDQLAASLRDIAESGITMEQVGFDADALRSILVHPHQRTLLNLGDGSTPPAPVDPDVPPENPPDVVTLAERFIVPPFTILDTRQGYWQDRKRRWISMGIASELGRITSGSVVPKDADGTLLIDQYRERNGEKPQNTKRLTYVKGDRPIEELDEVSRKIVGTGTGTSIFDPVLCELVYRWFSPPGGVVLDPFAGGSVRGVVAGMLGRVYHGIELRAEQVAANRNQRTIAPKDASITWVCGDSREEAPRAPEADLVFSCPPYADLEVYSDDTRDLSNMPYADFRTLHAEIIAKACARLRDNRFAVWVIGDVRDRDGNYLGLINDTIAAFRAAGLALYNEAILVNAVGSLPIRAGRMFTISRKMGKTHQNVLVFLKGDAKMAVAALGPVDVADFDGGGTPDDGGASGGDGLVSVRVTSKTLMQRFNGCDPEYIANVCKGACCRSSTSESGTLVTINPSEERRIMARGGVVVDGLLQPREGEKRCPFQNASTNLCDIHFTGDKPFGCIASPFTLAPGGKTLIVRNRYRMLKCYDDGKKIPAYVAFRASLDAIFGVDEASRIHAAMERGDPEVVARMTSATFDMLSANDVIKHNHKVGAGNGG